MVLTIGQMRSTVLFKTNTPTTLGAGQVDSYADGLQTRGRLRKNSGNRNLDFGMIVGNDTYTLECRGQAALSTIKVNGKVVIDNVGYNILSIEIIDQIGHWYKFQLSTQSGS